MSQTLPLQVTEEAARQIRLAASWWNENRPDARERLAEELEAAFRLLTIQPVAAPLVQGSGVPGLRRILLRNVQYHLYYVVNQTLGAIVVLAFWSARRGSPPPL